MTYPDYIDTTIEHLHTAKNSIKTEKSAIVVPKVPKKATFGTTIGTFFPIFHRFFMI